jgi:hypothetical protein
MDVFMKSKVLAALVFVAANGVAMSQTNQLADDSMPQDAVVP